MRRFSTISASAILVIAVRTAAQNPALYSEQNLLDFYAYDHTAALQVELEERAGTGLYHEYHLQFQSARRRLVTGILYVPKAASPTQQVRCLLWLHGYRSDKAIPGEALTVLGQLNYAILALDAEYHGERRQFGKDAYSLNLVENRYAFAQTIIDYRRALDFLGTVAEIDTARIGLLGASMGGILGALLAGVDGRIKVSVILAGGGGFRAMISQSMLPPAIPMRQYLRGNFNVIPRLLDPVDPLHLIHRVKNIQFHHGDQDDIVPYAAGLALYERAGEPKEFWTYPGAGHSDIGEGNNTITVIGRVLTWLNEHL